MDYTGEHLLPGQIGHFLVILSLVSSAVATIAFYFSFKSTDLNNRDSWKRLARMAFAIETVSVFGIFLALYYIISNHLFEYKYAWQHSSKSLQVEYLLSCFWEGQEGSFMLWSFWHCILGWVLIRKAGKWEGPVMTVVSFVQFALATMILGIYFFGFKVGSSPFVLLRNEMEAPIFSQPNYLEFVKDGNGLNALLQNYWMVIHPPILFLGFASTLVPFAYAIGGLLTRNHDGWAAPALPWASFSAAVLGLGIMMGAAWAYESLTFGGYWAWDPVENASLVPWLVLVSGIHTNLIFKSTGYSLRSTYLFYILSFLLVLYSTFLTRSGVLGDTSVHAFTDLGMNFQLLAFIGVFLVPAFWMLGRQFKTIPSIQKEENLYSREFWMFIGALVFFFSGLLIIGKTSLPVINKIFGSKIAPPEDVEFSHNQIQIWVAIIAGLLTAVTQYLRYKDTPKKTFYSKLLWPTAISLIASLAFSFLVGISYEKKGPGFWIALHAGVFMAVYAIVANAGYIWSGMKGKLRLAGASIAHIGFGMVLLGILISAGNKQTLSINTTGISPLKMQNANDVNNNPMENSTLIKGVATDMGAYNVIYKGDSVNPRDRKRYFEIAFNAKNGSDSFRLYPDIIENNKGGEGVTPNPDSKHYLHKDIFAYITFLTDPNAKVKDTTSFRNQTVVIGDTSFYSNGMWTVKQLELNPTDGRFGAFTGDTIVAANISVIAKDGRLYQARPAFRLKGNELEMLPDTVMSQSLIFALRKPGDIEKQEVEIGIKESNAILDFITLKVYQFPAINVLWLGVIVTVIGFLMSMVQRFKLLKND
jgi:cytochrome c-type biogenesis protein CcmF